MSKYRDNGHDTETREATKDKVFVSATVRISTVTRRGAKLHIQAPLPVTISDTIVEQAVYDLIQDVKETLHLP